MPVANLLQYVAGYIACKLSCLDCTECVSVLFLATTDVVCEQQLFLHIKSFTHSHTAFGKLHAASDKFMHCIKLMHKIFQTENTRY